MHIVFQIHQLILPKSNTKRVTMILTKTILTSKQINFPNPNQNNFNNQYAKLVPLKCYRCNVLCHKSNDCPQRCMVNVANVVEDEDSEEFGEMEEGEKVYVIEDFGEHINCMLQKVLLTPIELQYTQRHSIFKTKCTINK